MRVLTVTSETDFSEFAHSIAGLLRVESIVAVEAWGEGAVAHLLKALIPVRRIWQEESSELLYIAEVEGERAGGYVDEPYLRLTLTTSPTSGDDFAGPQTIDEEIEAQFDAWEVLPDENNELLEKIRQHHSESPILSGGDVDAAWDQANDVGEETVGGSTPTPDQDVVDELGEAAGLIYDDYEPLHTGEKLEKRDKHRWELDPASQDDESVD
jgi:stage V sporulation protein SpoVS